MLYVASVHARVLVSAIEEAEAAGLEYVEGPSELAVIAAADELLSVFCSKKDFSAKDFQSLHAAVLQCEAAGLVIPG